jgi:hypothetical protein
MKVAGVPKAVKQGSPAFAANLHLASPMLPDGRVRLDTREERRHERRGVIVAVAALLRNLRQRWHRHVPAAPRVIDWADPRIR